MLRSVIALILGLVAIAVAAFPLEFAVDAALLRLFPTAFPTREALAASAGVEGLTLAYTLGCAVLGGYVTARVAGRAGLKHALILAVVQDILTVIAMVERLAPAPRWAWVGSLVFVPLAIVCGGWLQARSRSAAG